MATRDDTLGHTPIPAGTNAEDYLEEGAGDATRNSKQPSDDSVHAAADGGASALHAKQKALLPKSVVGD